MASEWHFWSQFDIHEYIDVLEHLSLKKASMLWEMRHRLPMAKRKYVSICCLSIGTCEYARRWEKRARREKNQNENGGHTTIWKRRKKSFHWSTRYFNAQTHMCFSSRPLVRHVSVSCGVSAVLVRSSQFLTYRSQDSVGAYWLMRSYFLVYRELPETEARLTLDNQHERSKHPQDSYSMEPGSKAILWRQIKVNRERDSNDWLLHVEWTRI